MFSFNVQNKFISIAFAILQLTADHSSSLLLFSSSDFVHLPRFWTNIGFSPVAPLPLNNSQIAAELLSNNVKRNIEIIASLPNGAVDTIRTHWMLSLIRQESGNNSSEQYDFSLLDKYLDFLVENELAPVFELMDNFNTTDLEGHWRKLVMRILKRFTAKYSSSYMLRWKFETWNEPDLRTYNIHNFTENEYFAYINGIKKGLQTFNKMKNTRHELRGPAGLFKSIDKHKLCWGILSKCNSDIDWCPLNVITFHRKGQKSYSDILNDTISLIQLIHQNYPNLIHIPYANSEADPTSGWSNQYSPYSDVRYANMLILIVFEHWNALYTKQLKNLESISHDNAFISYHPFEFEQRTLLAKFAMNNTKPPHVQFIRKPVHAALGMLASLTEYASNIQISQNMVCLTSVTKDYGAVLCTSLKQNTTINYYEKITINVCTILSQNCVSRANAYFVEFLDNRLTNPYNVWINSGRPSFPNATIFSQMRASEGPHAFKKPARLSTDCIIGLDVNFTTPWVMLLRICTNTISRPNRVSNLRIRSITNAIILLLWNEPTYENNARCIQKYEIFFAEIRSIDKLNAIKASHHTKWINLTKDLHIPFMSYHYHCQQPICNLNGFYKVRGTDIFNRTGRFSKPVLYLQNKIDSNITDD